MTRDSTDFTGTPEVTAAQVIDFLQQHPDFLNRHPEVFDNQSAPERELGAGVADFQSAMIRRLRADVAGNSDRQRELIDTSRANLTIQARVHECVLALLEARSFEKVIETVATDLTVLLPDDETEVAARSRTHAVPESGPTALPSRHAQRGAALAPHHRAARRRGDRRARHV